MSRAETFALHWKGYIMSDEIKPGDVVRLKSGGPKMVVHEVGPEMYSDQPSVWCEWFNDKNEPKKGPFKLVSVEKVPASPSAAELHKGKPPVV
jgi:uncharacterized protein YodC (DUF2158 family)